MEGTGFPGKDRYGKASYSQTKSKKSYFRQGADCVYARCSVPMLGGHKGHFAGPSPSSGWVLEMVSGKQTQ